jgi:hypothetical protein
MAAAPDRRVIAVGLGIPLAILAVVAAVMLLDGGSDAEPAAPATTTTTTTAAAQVDARWDAAVAEAFEPLVDVLPEYARTVDAWSTGQRSAEELEATLDRVEPVVMSVAEAARDVPAHRDEPLARPLVGDAADLYVHAVAAHRAALAVDDPAIAQQWDRLGRRLRIVGDRTFDRARELTAPPFEPTDGIDLRLPAEVPDFDRLELAVGPPLEPADTNVVDALPRLREDERASQPAAAWRAAVEALEAPTVADVEAAVGDPDELASVARRFVVAADALREEPVPDGDRGRADRTALRWLVLADGARAAQLAELGGGVGDDVTRALLDVAAEGGLSEP